jgi:hypothetical protein
MSARTIVGSGPARRPLPLGREAVERALRLCEHWPPALARGQETPTGAAMRAYHLMRSSGVDEVVSWPPREVRERLRGYP